MFKKKTDTPATPKKDDLTPIVQVDRGGFDIGGSTGKTTAGTGVGLGPDAGDSRRDRRLPGRQGKPI